MTSIDALQRLVDSEFPGLWPSLNAVLSCMCALLIEDVVNPPSLILVRPSASAKTTVLDMVGEIENLTYRSDNFTPKAFVSHASNVKREQLEKIDLLPRIKHKTLVTPELAPIFRGNDERLTETFSILTALLDGHGFTSDSGVQGRLGYTGDEWLFSWIGATTPLAWHVWRVMAQLGSRLFFYSMPEKEETDDDLVALVRAGSSYRDRLAKVRVAMAEFLPRLFSMTGGVRGTKWNRASDPRAALQRIARLSRLVARLRGIVSVWKEDGQDTDFGYSPPNIENPKRAFSVLYNLARGHAILHGRTQLTEADLPLITAVALSSAPTDRIQLFRGLITSGGTLSTTQVGRLLSVSRGTAAKAMKIMALLGLAGLDEVASESGGTPAHILTLESAWRWCLDLFGGEGGDSREEVCASEEEPEEIL
jgi:hypothetical protein